MGALRPGQLLDGTSYQVIRELGAGGMGVVYEIEHVRLKKRYVAKVIHEQVAHDASVARRMEREAQVLAAISHPNIVQVHDVGVTFDGISYFVMEKLEGRDLRHFMKRGRVPPHRATAIVSDVLDALEHVHGRGIIHRDIKPENIFLADGPHGPITKVLDFGIVHVLDQDGHASQARITKTGGFVGTLYYAAPEQMQGKPAGPANDVYAAGLVVFELLAGKGPFDDDPGVGLSRCFKPAPLLTDFVPTAQPELASLIARALEQDPSLRPSAGTLAAELRVIARALAAAHGPEEDAVRAEVDDLLRHMAPYSDARPLPRAASGGARAVASASTPPAQAMGASAPPTASAASAGSTPPTVASARHSAPPGTSAPATPIMPGAPRPASRPSLNDAPTMASPSALTPAAGALTPAPASEPDAPAPHLSTSPGLYATVDGPPVAAPPTRSRMSWIVAGAIATIVLGAGAAGAIAIHRHAGGNASMATATSNGAPSPERSAVAPSAPASNAEPSNAELPNTQPTPESSPSVAAPVSASAPTLAADPPPAPDPRPKPSPDPNTNTASTSANASPDTPATATAAPAKTPTAAKATSRAAAPKPADTAATPPKGTTIEVDMDGRVIRR